MDNKDLDVFKEEVSWFFKADDKIEFKPTKPNFSTEFKETFPKLLELLSRAEVLEVNLIREEETILYKLFSWTDSENLKSGWLCKFEKIENGIKILPEHQLLLDNIGGIQENYHQLELDYEILADNQFFLFIHSECTSGMGEMKKYYEEICEEEQTNPIETKDLICFVEEANSNRTYYNIHTKEILLYAHDHGFDFVEVLEGQPEYTFYTINGVNNFVDYVETVAKEWLVDILK